MARYFKEQDIDEFRECFYLFARSGQITSLDELTVVMRSLGMSPTIQELAGYLKGKGGKMSFADFLEVMHIHSRAENLPNEERTIASNHNNMVSNTSNKKKKKNKLSGATKQKYKALKDIGVDINKARELATVHSFEQLKQMGYNVGDKIPRKRRKMIVTNEETQGPGNNQQGPHNNQQGPCKNQQAPSQNQQVPYTNQLDPCNTQEDPYNNQQGPCKNQQGPTKNQEDPYNNQQGPCKNQQDSYDNELSPCNTEEGPNNNQEGPNNNQQGPNKNHQGPCQNQLSTSKEMTPHKKMQSLNYGIKDIKPMTDEKMAELYRVILKKISFLPPGKGPNFGGFSLKPGWISISCEDARSISWLQKVVPKIIPWPGASLSLINEQNIQKPTIGLIFIPYPEAKDVKEALKCLRAQNPGLNCNIWKILSIKNEHQGVRLTLSIDEDSAKTLRNNDFIASLGLRKVVNAFRAGDADKMGVIPARQLRNLLQNWGEGLSAREVDNIFREANVSNSGAVRYEDFVKIACAPVPDYY